MRDALFNLRTDSQLSIQAQIRELIVDAVLSEQLSPGDRVPSCRRMARRLAVARNTVAYAYQRLVADGYLLGRERSGYYVAKDVLQGRARAQKPQRRRAKSASAEDWSKRFRVRPSVQANIVKPKDWHRYQYPFVYGQTDRELFPLAEWRECSRQLNAMRTFDQLTSDSPDADDPELVDQIRRKLLPRRGVSAQADEILVTLGAQNALYMIVGLLVGPSETVVMGNPGYPDFRNSVRLRTNRLRTIPVDGAGLPVDARLDGANYVFVTPSHHFPTTVTMSKERRRLLLNAAAAHDFVIIEDDYEPEANYIAEASPALKSSDTDGRVIYVGSLSKSLFPGLRLGYIVGPPNLIAEMRALRRLMFRHPPTTTQRVAGLFIAQGHHETHVRRQHCAYKQRWETMKRALDEQMPGMSTAPTFGGTSFWVRGPAQLDSGALAQRAAARGVIIEPGAVHFAEAEPPRNFFRLGFSSIDEVNIYPGIRIIAELIGAN